MTDEIFIIFPYFNLQKSRYFRLERDDECVFAHDLCRRFHFRSFVIGFPVNQAVKIGVDAT
jgi:hypothetical protein